MQELRQECTRWMQEIKDLGEVPALEIIERFWPNQQQPITATPTAEMKDGKLHLACATEGASIGYKLPKDEVAGVGWRVYTKPIEVDAPVKIIAHRIGYKPSEILNFSGGN